MLLEVFLILTTLQAQETNARFRDRSIIGSASRSLGSVTTFPRLLPPGDYTEPAYAIGDVHGSFETLHAFFTTYEIGDTDRVVYCGDLVDRKPRISETLDFILSREHDIVLLGNHDFSFVDWFKLDGRERNIGIYRQGHYNWRYDETFSTTDHLWNRINDQTHRDYDGPIIVHGHTPCLWEDAIETKGLLDTPFAINLDSGCVYARSRPWASLRRLRLSDGAILEQRCLDQF